MALDTLKRQGKSAAVGLLGKNLRRVAGNVGAVLSGAIGGSDASQSAPINRSKQSTDMLAFPLDVGADPGIGNNGHYIMFFINEQKDTKLSFGDEAEAPKGAMNMEKALSEKGIPGIQKIFESKLGSFVQKAIPNLVSNNLLSGFTDIIGNLKTDTTGRMKHNPKTEAIRIQEKTSSIAVERSPTKRLSTAISMYMPTNIKVNYGVDIAKQEIGVAVSEMLKIPGGDAALKQGKIKSGLKTVGEAMKRKGIEKVGALPGFDGALEAMELKEGAIFSKNIELAFKGVGKRKFQYTFKMMPRSQAEADEIQKIIYAFKFNMLPEFQDGVRGRKMKVPNTFDIQYMYQNEHNNYLNKISTCFLETMDVTYGGTRYKTFDSSSTLAGAPPVETTIELNFSEMETITRERVTEGF